MTPRSMKFTTTDAWRETFTFPVTVATELRAQLIGAFQRMKQGGVPVKFTGAWDGNSNDVLGWVTAVDFAPDGLRITVEARGADAVQACRAAKRVYLQVQDDHRDAKGTAYGAAIVGASLQPGPAGVLAASMKSARESEAARTRREMADMAWAGRPPVTPPARGGAGQSMADLAWGHRGK